MRVFSVKSTNTFYTAPLLKNQKFISVWILVVKGTSLNQPETVIVFMNFNTKLVFIGFFCINNRALLIHSFIPVQVSNADIHLGTDINKSVCIFGQAELVAFILPFKALFFFAVGNVFVFKMFCY